MSQALKRYSEDRIGMVDYALESGGVCALLRPGGRSCGARQAGPQQMQATAPRGREVRVPSSAGTRLFTAAVVWVRCGLGLGHLPSVLREDMGNRGPPRAASAL